MHEPQPAFQRPRDWTIMVGAAGGRVVFGLVFAPFVAVTLSPSESARVYQLLFLQGALIALLSASAYARGAQLAQSRVPIWRSTRKLTGFLALSGTGALLAASVLVPAPGPDRIIELASLALVVSGAAAAALNGFLQGVTVVQRSGAAAFLPSLLVTAAACAGVLTLWRPQQALTVVVAWSLPQLLSPVALLLAVPQARGFFRRGSGDDVEDQSYFAATGLVNAGSIGVSYAYRERWAAAQSTAHAATGFLVVRVSELLYQVLYMTVASFPDALNRLFGAHLNSARGQTALLVGAAPAVGLAVVPAAVWDEWTVSRFVVAELLVAPARILTMLCLLTLLARTTTRAYQVAVLVGLAGSGLLMVIPSLQTSAYGLQAFQAANTAAAVLVGALVHRMANPRLGVRRGHH